MTLPKLNKARKLLENRWFRRGTGRICRLARHVRIHFPTFARCETDSQRQAEVSKGSKMKSLVIGTAVVAGTIGLGSATTAEAGHGHGHGHGGHGHGGVSVTFGGYGRPGYGYPGYGHHHHHHHHPHVGYYQPMPAPVIIAPQPAYPVYYPAPYPSGFGLQTRSFGLYIR